MTPANALAAVPPSLRLTPRMVVAAWRGITPAQVRTTFLLGCVLFLRFINVAVAESGLRYLLFILALAQIKVFVLLLAIVVADRATGNDPDRRSAYLLAVVAGAAAGTLAAEAAGIFVLSPLLLDGPYDTFSFSVGWLLYLFLDLAMVGGAAVWVMLDRRRAARAHALLHRAELARIDAAKRTVESELQAMQARVEPQFLFNTLAHVKRLYDDDASLGERMLDELIAYLRAAMPRMRDTSSTVGQEIALARAWLGVVKARLPERFTVDVDVKPGVEAMQMPPMILLPLLERALANGPVAASDDPGVRIRFEAVDGTLKASITAAGFGDDRAAAAPEPPGTGIAGIRERLHALYGGAASFELTHAGEQQSRAIIELPLERAPSG
ncbi:MAG TPA: histidine kinase [Casimicrobiaceae bacterium]